MAENGKKRSTDTWVAVVAVVGLCGALYWGVHEHFGKSDLAAKDDVTRGSLDAETKKSSGLADALSKCQSDLDAAKQKGEDAAALVETTGTSLMASQSELAELRAQKAEADARLAAFKTIAEKLKKMIDAGKLRVHVRNGLMVVELPAGILFASGSADLSKDGDAAVREVAGILKTLPDRKFMVSGHTDNVPLGASKSSKDTCDEVHFKDNWELSAARAVNVTELMVKSGMNPTKLVAAGYGEFDPIRENSTDAGRAANRRIEIVLLPNVAELPTMADALASNNANTAGK